jgi:hypothetical protein
MANISIIISSITDDTANIQGLYDRIKILISSNNHPVKESHDRIIQSLMALGSQHVEFHDILELLNDKLNLTKADITRTVDHLMNSTQPTALSGKYLRILKTNPNVGLHDVERIVGSKFYLKYCDCDLSTICMIELYLLLRYQPNIEGMFNDSQNLIDGLGKQSIYLDEMCLDIVLSIPNLTIHDLLEALHLFSMQMHCFTEAYEFKFINKILQMFKNTRCTDAF